MGGSEDRIEKKVPLTAELGDEGGSYADGAVQAETFKGERGSRRIDPKAVAPEAQTADAVSADATPEDIIRHADEPGPGDGRRGPR